MVVFQERIYQFSFFSFICYVTLKYKTRLMSHKLFNYKYYVIYCSLIIGNIRKHAFFTLIRLIKY